MKLKRKSFFKSLFTVISDIRFSLIGLIIYALAIATATFIENSYGTEIAFKAVYNNIAFYLLLLFLILGFISNAKKRNLRNRKRYGAIFIHSAFIIILLGALTTNILSSEGTMHLREGDTSSDITIDDSKIISRPYSITLKDFAVEYYEGGEFPSAYKCFVEIKDGKKQYDAVIELNSVLNIDGDRIYQKSFDTDKKGVTLLINSDFAGTTVTYIGYIVLLIGFILSLFGKESRIKDILKDISKNSKVIIIVFIFSSVTQTTNAFNIDNNILIPYEDAKKWEQISVLSNSGMVEPLECHARTVLRKLTKSNGKDADEWGARVYMSIIAYPEKWSNTPFIYCKNKNVCNALNIPFSKFIAFNDLFDSFGNYKLSSLKATGETGKELKKLDERAHIFAAIANGSLLKIFPIKNGNWGTPIKNGYTDSDSVFAKTIFPQYIAFLTSNNSKRLELIDHIASFQRFKHPEGIPSSTKINLAIFYSRAPIFKIAAFGYIILGIILTFLSIKYLGNKSFIQQIKIGAIVGAIFAIFLLHTGGIILRWYISEQPPWSNTYETMLFIAWSMILGGMFFIKRNSIVCGLSAVMAAVTLFISTLNWLDPVITPLMPVLNSPWLIFHVTIITAGYGFLGICAIIGLSSLIISLKQNSAKDVAHLSLINELFMYLGLILITIGTFLGAVWANQSWSRYWGWDAKESWALVTILVYTIITHTRLIHRWRNDIIFSALSVYALLSILMTYFGVNYYLSGLHSYGNSDNAPAVGYVAIGYGVISLVSIIAWIRNRKGLKQM
ncbi:MAG: cytochrome c biogenesis protein CcsA [Bacteroidales bacterium]|nr:cytochrome c biogenesis protein CcsA [Bacteroidales bacterium]